MELDSATMQILGIIVTVVTALIAGVGELFRRMWNGRAEELRIARERVDKLEVVADRRIREREYALIDANTRNADLQETIDVRLIQLESESGDRHAEWRQMREAKGGAMRADDEEAREAMHLNRLSAERTAITTDKAPDRLREPPQE